MKYLTVKNPIYSNAEQTLIDCEVDFVLIGVLMFTASPTDSTEHGREIFERCVSGEFGLVGEYVPPPEPMPELLNSVDVK